MKKGILFLVALTGFISSVAASDKTAITGTLINANEKTILLERFEKTSASKIDSAIVSKKGKFLLEATVNETGFYRISIVPNDFIILVIQPGEKIHITADGKNLNRTYSVKGSLHSLKLQEFVNIVNNYVNQRDSLQTLVRNYAGKGDQTNAAAAKRMADDAYVKFVAERDTFINRNPESPALIGVLNHLNLPAEISQLRKIEHALAVSMPDSPFHASVQEMVKNNEAKITEQERIKIAQEELASRMSPGKVAPEISMQDRDGNILSLSSLKGKYVLIDFWASWCGPCRKENPNVVALYKKYAEKGFTVYSVSLDNSKPNWLAAIEKDGLAWPNHVSELRGWQTSVLNTYGVTGIPFTVLIDKEGKIIQTHLRGPALENKLKEIFGF